MSYKEVRLLNPDEISCRVQSVSKDGSGAVILLYKDARTDMNLLDETYGAMNWQREHISIDGDLYCNISIWDADKMSWITKQDVGTESMTEATKGQASDAFKRAGFNWGIGRELYTAPFTYVKLRADEVNEYQGKYKVKPSFGLVVKEISYNENKVINKLIIVDKKGTVRFTMYAPADDSGYVEDIPKAKIPAKVTVKTTNADLITAWCEKNDVAVKNFGSVLATLQKEGSVPNKLTKDMSSIEIMSMLKTMSELMG